MNQNAYIARTNQKIKLALELYAQRFLHEIGEAANVLACETEEHLRLVPENSVMHPIAPGTAWGKEWGNLWLRTSFTVPEEAAGREICAIPETEAVEILCFKDGKPSGIINSKNKFLGGNHSCMILEKSAVTGTTYDIAFECYAGHTCFGKSPYDSYMRDETVPDRIRKKYSGIRFYSVDEEIRQFCFDLAIVIQLSELPGENFAAMRAHECLMEAFPYLIQDVREASDGELRESAQIMRKILAPALVKRENGDRSRGYVGVIGHSHMDTAWLWPVSETIRKCARTYAEVLTLMDMYPDYTFIQSSVLHLDWMKRYYPSIFEGIRKRCAEGRYEPNGAVWVECDCNITGGEAMIRQFLVGQRYTEKELNYHSDSFWLPDTFGYSGAIPQIMRGTGVKYFYTTKMAWNDLNVFPADTFVWRGIDGSEVIAHLNCMQAIPNVDDLTAAVSGISDKSSNDMRLCAYGFGDGGGGPTEGMLEYLHRTKDLDGLPQIVPTTVSGFMHKLEERRDRLPLYDGELYLEFHRGTLTSLHDVKKNNRLAEFALHDYELMKVLAGVGKEEKDDEYWKILLKNQFHDILPGSSIPKVYEICIPEMQKLIADLRRDTLALAKRFSDGDGNALSLVNPLSFAAETVVTLDGEQNFAGTDCQSYTDPAGNTKTVLTARLPATGAAVLERSAAVRRESAFRSEGDRLVTPYYDVTFDENGYIASLTDRRVNRIVHRPGGTPLGTLWFGENLPTRNDNWEIEDDIFLKLKPLRAPVRRETVSDGAVMYRIRTEYRFGHGSSCILDTVFYAKDPRIDYEMRIDWHERHALLKAGFDVNIRSAFMKNEIQFGHADRPTTRNNSIEAARFEVCNHKWTDLSETRYGVAVLNDCKYGISCEGGDLRLTLQKGGTRPDPFTDMGIHTFSYALLPHVGGFSVENVILPAYLFNEKPIAVPGRVTLPALCSVSAPNILCESVKNAEDAANAYVLRLYECERSASNCTVTFTGAKRVTVCNMLEEPVEVLPLTDGRAALTFRPFEIKTLLVER